MHKTSEWLLSFTNDQEAKRRSQSHLNIRKFEACRKVSITGGKGGVGKTSIALKMAKELALAGYRTLLIDCDSNLSNTAIKLNLPIDNKFEKLLSSEISFEDCLIQRGNFHLLPACNGSTEIFDSRLNFDEVMIDIISSHEHEYDFVLLDCPAGISREALTLNAYCDYRLVVVTPDKSSITDSYSLIKILGQRFDVKTNHILVNMFQSDRQFQKVVTTLTETVENFIGSKTFLFGGIPRLDASSEGFDGLFLSEAKSAWHKNFIKYLYEFTEKSGGQVDAQKQSRVPLAYEQDVH